MDCSLPDSPIHGTFQARVLEWVAISFSRGSSQPRDGTQIFPIASRRFTIWATREVPSESRSVVSDSLWPHGLYGPWNSPGQNTGVSSSSLLQVIFPTQGSNPGLLHCRQTLYPLSHQGILHYKIHSKYFIISIYYKTHSNYSDNRLESIQTTFA